MDNELKSELIINAASRVHHDWCMAELKKFYERAQRAKEKGLSLEEALKEACIDDRGKPRNEVEIDKEVLLSHIDGSNTALDSFDNFIKMIESNAITVKRFTRRDLTPEEIIKAAKNYKADTKEENILRDFIMLSSSSKKENLEAAIGAYNVYEEMSKSGITIEQMENNPEIKNLIGVAIHLDWMKRNMNHPNEDLKVPYENLDEYTKSQDLTVFYALIKNVKENAEKYLIAAVQGHQLPDFLSEQEEFFKLLGTNNVKL